MKDKKGIKSWAKEDRPREKLLLKGRENLTDAELLAILIGSGSFNVSAVQLAKDILSTADHNLNNLGKKSTKDLLKFNGIGEAKAITIIAALELGKRRQAARITSRPKISCSKDAYQLLYPLLQDLPHEVFYILLLNRANIVTKKLKISSGGIAGTIVDSKLILKEAIEELSSAIILAHNHPSGNIKPSKEDIRITKKIKEAASYFDIKVLDHIIIGDQTYYSFGDEQLI